MRLLVTALVAVAFAGSSGAAQPVVFSGKGAFASAPGVAGLTTGSFSFAFTLPKSPAPTVSIPEQTFVLADVSGLFNQGATTTPVTGNLFFFTSGLGGLFGFDVNFQTLLNPFDGPQLFAGSTDAPAFVLGSWTPADPLGLGIGSVTQLSIAITSVPEPATVMLVGAGIVVLASCQRRRRLDWDHPQSC